AGTEIQNNLNRTLEFVSDEVRRASIIAKTETEITSTQVPTGARAVLAFQIPNPNSPGQILPNQIVYYTNGPENSLTGPRVLWRFGPDLDVNGNYINPADTVDGFFTCIRAGGGQVILNANAQVEMTTVTNGNRDKVNYSLSTRVSPRATN
ncbi:MAG: hypothetical protein ACKO2T_25480, partial [Microcystis aeruginosa]